MAKFLLGKSYYAFIERLSAHSQFQAIHKALLEGWKDEIRLLELDKILAN